MPQSKQEIEQILNTHYQAMLRMLEISRQEEGLALEKRSAQKELLLAREAIRSITF